MRNDSDWQTQVLSLKLTFFLTGYLCLWSHHFVWLHSSYRAALTTAEGQQIRQTHTRACTQIYTTHMHAHHPLITSCLLRQVRCLPALLFPPFPSHPAESCRGGMQHWVETRCRYYSQTAGLRRGQRGGGEGGWKSLEAENCVITLSHGWDSFSREEDVFHSSNFSKAAFTLQVLNCQFWFVYI